MSVIAEYNSRTIYLLLGISCYLIPYACSAVNISENEEVATGFIGRIIYTKWCGPGNDAQHYDDLGENFEIDKCCRDHDFCKLSIKSGETKYGYTNDDLFTVSGCSCDSTLRGCLENATFRVADLVVRLYAFTNKRCLINVCDLLPWWRCPREDNIRLSISNHTLFEGIEPADDTEALNQLIRERMANDQNKKPIERVHAQNPVPYQWQQRVQYNQNYQSTQNPHALVHSLHNTVHYPWHPWQLQRIDNLQTELTQPIHQHQSAHSEYQTTLPNQRQPHTVCCVDEFQLQDISAKF